MRCPQHGHAQARQRMGELTLTARRKPPPPQANAVILTRQSCTWASEGAKKQNKTKRRREGRADAGAS